jgi:HD-GYP domain-containing protein (c-di-GMP phosphodiesterase class II)
MRLTAVSRAAGLTLARELPATGPVPLLQAGAELTQEFCDALLAQGVRAVWIADELSEGITPTELLPEHVRREAIAGMRAAVDAAGEAFRRQTPLPEETVKELTSITARIVASISDEPDATLALVDLAGAHDDIHHHSVNVCALGIALGHVLFRRNGWIDWDGRRRRDRIEERLVILGVGLMLHDIGKLGVPAAILAKPEDELSAQERATLHTHPQIGLDLLRSNSISLVVRSIVRDHHESWDGTGYPRAVERAAINPLARIAAVANMYDKLVGTSPAAAVAAVADASSRQLDPEVVEVFRRMVFPYPVGTEVDVDHGILGVVCRVDPADPEVPVVRFAGSDGPIELPIDTRTRVVSVVAA